MVEQDEANQQEIGVGVTFQTERKTEMQPIDHTKFVVPLKDWVEIEKTWNDWLLIVGKNGLSNLRRCMWELGMYEVIPSHVSTPRGRQMFDYLWKTFQLENRMICKPNPNLPFPERGDFSYGYSWPAWRQAARYAGAKEPPHSLNSLLVVAGEALEYHAGVLRSWQTDYTVMSLDLKDLLENGDEYQNVNDIVYKTKSVIRIADRLSNFFQATLLWRNIVKSTRLIIDSGIKYKGRQTLRGITQDKSVQYEYSLLHKYIHWLELQQTCSLIKAFCESGRMKDNIQRKEFPEMPYLKWNLENDLFDLPNVDYKLLSRMEAICERNYLDFAILRLCGRRRDQKHFEPHDEHHILAYEQAIKNDPALAQGVSRLVQQLIGEKTMSMDFSSTFHQIIIGKDTHTNRCAPPPPGCVTSHFEDIEGLKLVLDKAKKIFAEPFPDFAKIYDNGDVKEDGCALLWEHWNSTSIRFYDKPLNDLFELTDLLTPPAPQWKAMPDETISAGTPEDQSINLIKKLDVMPLVQSGHSYYHQQHASSGNQDLIKVKKSGITANSTSPETDNNLEVKVEPCEQSKVVFKVNKKQLKLIDRLFSRSSEEGGQGQVKWDDIYKLMRRIGFHINHVGGSIIRFVPPNNAGIPFNEHRPHPETSIPAVRYRAFGKRLVERYGWDRWWFEKTSSME